MLPEDYDLENVSTWEPTEAPSLDSSWVEQLNRIGGLNPFDEPILIARWGASHRDPMSEDHGLKYWLANKEPTLIGFGFTDPITGMDLVVDKLEGVPKHILVPIAKYSAPVELGERRWIIERWRSQEFLAKSQRYTDTSARDQDVVKDFLFCRNCHSGLPRRTDGEPEKCQKCGSGRHYVREARFEGDGKLLKTDTSKGTYDFFLRLENADGEAMEADGHALYLIAKHWNEEHEKSRIDKLTDMLAETQKQALLNENATSPQNPFQTPALPGW